MTWPKFVVQCYKNHPWSLSQKWPLSQKRHAQTFCRKFNFLSTGMSVCAVAQKLWARETVRPKFFKLKKNSTYKKTSAHSFWATGLILVSNEAEFCALQSNRDFFSISEFVKKLRLLEFQFFRHFLDKNTIFSTKKNYNSKNRIKLKKISVNFVEHKILLHLIPIWAL